MSEETDITPEFALNERQILREEGGIKIVILERGELHTLETLHEKQVINGKETHIDRIITICWDAGFQPEKFHKVEFVFSSIFDKSYGGYLKLRNTAFEASIFQRHFELVRKFCKDMKYEFINRTPLVNLKL